MDLSVVVLSWNTRDLTLRALRAAAAGAGDLEAERICVDNASRDDTVEAVRAALPEVRVVRNDRNLGFAAGNNRALPLLRGRHVCFLNSDAAPHPGALAHLVRYLDAHSRVGAVAPRLVGADGRPQRAAREEASLLGLLHRYTPLRYTPFGRRRARAWTRGIASDVPRRAASLSGACLVLPRALLLALGGFDEGYPFYFEDLDLCRRVRAAGREVVYVPDGPPVEHAGGAATARAGGPPRLGQVTGLARYARARLGPGQGQAYVALLVPGVVALAVLEAPRLLLRAAARAALGERDAARRRAAAAGSWLRLLERDVPALLRLLARPR